MDLVTNIIVNGLAYGAMCAILAAGFSLIFGVAKILNMAHTAFYMITSFLIFSGVQRFHIPLVPAALLAILLTIGIALVMYKLFFDRVREHETAVMIISIALAMLFQEIFLLLFGAHYNVIPPFISGFMDVGGTRITYKHIFASGVCFVTLLGLWGLLSKTRLGNAIQCVAQDPEVASLVGIDVSRICMVTMGISAGLAGIAGAVLAPIYMVHPFMWMQPLVMVLAAVVLGGLGSVKGSIIAAVMLGFAETLVTFLVPDGSFLRGAVSLAVMVVVLVIRPEGFYGVGFEEERL
jgi:branched-chain amino acid transport system permease protein